MMTPNNVARLLCLLVAVQVYRSMVNAISYYPSDSGSHLGEQGNSFYETAASAQINNHKTCFLSGDHQVCKSVRVPQSTRETIYIHVCPRDGDSCNPNHCYYSSVPLCCSNATELGCVATSNILVDEETIKLTINQVSLSGEICVLFSPDVNACDANCVPECQAVTTCTNNTICDIDGSNCRCKEGYSASGENDCCNCAEGNNTHGYYKMNGTCKVYCRSNCLTGMPRSPCLTCRQEGFLPPTCCDCNNTGNDTHAFYKTPDGDCKSFCKQNCAIIGNNGCDQCRSGYIAVPECCTLDICDKEQDLYFLIDATASNNYFCDVIVVIQMLVAAFNPSSSSGTKISAVLFGEGDTFGPSDVFDSSMNCYSVVNERLVSLITEFGECLDNYRYYISLEFPSLCGQSTSAVSGLNVTANKVQDSGRNNAALVVLTDGTIDDDESKRKAVLKRLENVTIIVGGIKGGISGASRENLNLYSDYVSVEEHPVDLGINIVGLLNATGVLCPDHADNITKSLESDKESGKIHNFCACHRKKYKEVCTDLKYPTCGGSVSVDYTTTSSQQEPMSWEKDILAAVESVLEKIQRVKD